MESIDDSGSAELNIPGSTQHTVARASSAAAANASSRTPRLGVFGVPSLYSASASGQPVGSSMSATSMVVVPTSQRAYRKNTLGAPPDKPNKLRRKSSLSTAGMRPRTAPVAFSPDDVTDMFTEISVIQGSQEEDNTSSGASVTKDDDPSTQQQRQFKRAPRFSIATKERSIAAKIYFEHYFDRLFSGKSSNPTASSSRTRRRIQIEQELDRLGVSDAEKTKIREEWLAKERVMTRTSRDRMSLEKFEVIKPLGKGAFGFVRLVREKASGVLYAMKTLKKEDMLRNKQESHVRAERDILSDAANDESCRRLIKLIYSFQDPDHLHFIMEYCPGGDLLSLLIQFDTFPEEMARFYAAEMLLCVGEAHQLGYVHRDLKPDNFLIDARGRLRLGDCGLATDFHWSHESKYYDVMRRHTYQADCNHANGQCSCVSKSQKMEQEFLATERQELDAYIKATESSPADGKPLSMAGKHDGPSDSTDMFFHPPQDHRLLTWRARTRLKHPHARTYSVVGTNNYIAPEVLLGQPYDYSCDWWSLGIIIFEMLYGYPPFASKTREGTRTKIIEWRRWLKFPNYVTRKTESGEYDYAGEVSRDACDIIRKLLTDAAERIGSLQPQQLTQSGSSENAAAARSAAILSTMLLGKDGQEIQKHPWFRGVDFGALWEKEAPWKPDLKSDVDTSYFDEMLNDVGVAGPYGAGLGTTAELLQDEGAIAAATAQTGPSSADTDAETLELRKRLAFTGFTYKGAASLRSEFIKQIQTPPPQRRGSASNGNRPS